MPKTLRWPPRSSVCNSKPPTASIAARKAPRLLLASLPVLLFAVPPEALAPKNPGGFPPSPLTAGHSLPTLLISHGRLRPRLLPRRTANRHPRGPVDDGQSNHS